MATSQITFLSGLLEGLTPEQFRVVSGKFHQRKIAKGSTIFTQGEFPDSVYFIEAGRVKLSAAKGRRDAEVTLLVVGQGDLFGMADIFCTERRQSAVALEDLVVQYLSKETMIEMMLMVPQFAVNLLQAASVNFLKLIDRTASYSGSWAYRRLASALLRLSAEGDPMPEGIRLKSGVTHEFLASLIGSARETVTLGLKKLKETEAVAQDGRVLTVNPELLRQIAEESE